MDAILEKPNSCKPGIRLNRFSRASCTVNFDAFAVLVRQFAWARKSCLTRRRRAKGTTHWDPTTWKRSLYWSHCSRAYHPLWAHGYEVAKLTEQGLLTQMQHACFLAIAISSIHDFLLTSLVLVCAEAARKPSKTCAAAALCVCETCL